jgi:hypothetical protein
MNRTELRRQASRSSSARNETVNTPSQSPDGGCVIAVKKINGTTFVVTVTSTGTTTHRVTLTPEYYQKLSGGTGTAEDLIARSFEFLLERENNTSILRSFDLPTIARYFPEYESEITRER